MNRNADVTLSVARQLECQRRLVVPEYGRPYWAECQDADWIAYQVARCARRERQQAAAATRVRGALADDAPGHTPAPHAVTARRGADVATRQAFAAWLAARLAERALSWAAFDRIMGHRAGRSAPWRHGQALPTAKSCGRIAAALDLPESAVRRAAGKLPG